MALMVAATSEAKSFCSCSRPSPTYTSAQGAGMLTWAACRRVHFACHHKKTNKRPERGREQV